MSVTNVWLYGILYSKKCLSFASENSLWWNRFCHLQKFFKPARFWFNSALSLGCSYIFDDHFSGLGRAIAKMYVCVCHLNQMTFDVGIWHAVSSRSNSKVKVYSHRKKVTLSAMDVHYEVTFCRCTLRRDVFWLYVQFFWLKWSVRPRMTVLVTSVFDRLLVEDKPTIALSEPGGCCGRT